MFLKFLLLITGIAHEPLKWGHEKKDLFGNIFEGMLQLRVKSWVKAY
ncbi:hypothetical protein QQ020_21495 [Fulvivirgaceae bacterium BMA12]|uniref:Uncharacterized protein n=1 Tax=Agaribacillus aureus TaxID=3051825 RepID=A0ABT8LAA4_9BACT|nr:hypothetical protein [Fulvivirgaceae bacterium BMA12]